MLLPNGVHLGHLEIITKIPKTKVSKVKLWVSGEEDIPDKYGRLKDSISHGG